MSVFFVKLADASIVATALFVVVVGVSIKLS